MNPLVDVWLRLVNRTGSEIPVTLLVSGKRITGFLTPLERFRSWEREVLARASRTAEGFSFPSEGLGPITPEMSKKVQDLWPELERDLESEPSSTAGFTYLCIRDATMHEVVPVASSHFPMLLIAAPAVEGFMPGKQS